MLRKNLVVDYTDGKMLVKVNEVSSEHTQAYQVRS